MTIGRYSIPPSSGIVVSDRTLYLCTVVAVMPLPLLILWKPFLAVAYAAAPAALLLLAHGPAAVFLLIGATFFFFPLDVGLVLLPADIVALVLFLAYGADLLLRRPHSHENLLAGPYLLYACILLLSAAFQGFTGSSVRFLMRQALLLATFLAVAHFGDRVKTKHILGVFIAFAIGNSLLSIGQFAAAGGTIRAFGMAGRGYGDHVMIGFLIASVMYVWSDDLRGQVGWGATALLMIGAIAATQTRASAITAGVGLVTIVITAIAAERRAGGGRVRRRLAAALILAAVIIPILALYTPVFEGIWSRFGRLGFQPSETIRLRFSLWKAALTAFWAHPVLGIGAGNFSQVFTWVPDVRFDMVFRFVSGMGTHAQVITALAETGILGCLALLVFLFKAVKTAYRRMTAAVAIEGIVSEQCLFAIALAIFVSSLYAGSWFWGNNSYHLAVFFGLIAANHPQSEPEKVGRPSAG